MGMPIDIASVETTEVDAFRRLFPVDFYERHFHKSARPDDRPISHSRDTSVAFGFFLSFFLSLLLSAFLLSLNFDFNIHILGAVTSANGSALVKLGCTTMLAAIKMEIMTPSLEAPDEGNLAIEFHMPPICSTTVRPGWPAEGAPVISKQLADTIFSAGMIDLKELCLVSGKAAWMAYLDICCLDADGSLFDAALLSAVAAFSHLQIPVVSLNEEGRVFIISEEEAGKSKKAVNKEKRKLTLSSIPLSLTCVLHKNYILPDPTAEEESIIETSITVVLNSSDQLVSLYKPGGQILAFSEAIEDCVALTKQRVKDLQRILEEAMSGMEVD